jgi:intracellular sulfur oxidation DsrE/DsrF family protein
LFFNNFNATSVTDKPKFVVVFIGPSAKLISTNREGVPAEDHKMLDAIAEKISEMAKDGIRFEICLFAARMFNVDPVTILPEINQVENGVISLIGYQTKGFALVPIY